MNFGIAVEGKKRKKVSTAIAKRISLSGVSCRIKCKFQTPAEISIEKKVKVNCGKKSMKLYWCENFFLHRMYQSRDSQILWLYWCAASLYFAHSTRISLAYPPACSLRRIISAHYTTTFDYCTHIVRSQSITFFLEKDFPS